MTDEEIKPHLEALIRWCDEKVKSDCPYRDKYYYIGVLNNLRALLTREETMSQFFERKVLNPHNFPSGELVKIGDKLIEMDKGSDILRL